MIDLSVLIPARNEMFLNNTIQDILAHSEADTEIIVVLDGSWPVEPIPDHDRVVLVYHPHSVGQRAATNEAARLARGRYVMKCDAHCAFGPGFDRIMLEDIQPDWTMVPTMYNLHAFDWVCRACGWRKYQGPTPKDGCPECKGQVERELIWKAKPSPTTTAMSFDRNLKFQYWGKYKERQKGELADTMSLLGACWMLSRERYFQLNICDEAHGSWGQQGTEVACKTWLSGGRLVCTKKTWFAHLFRTQGGDFGFPYPLSGQQTRHARDYSKELWRADAPDEMPRWAGAKYPLSWLVERFAPVPGWHDAEAPADTKTDAEAEGLDDAEAPALVKSDAEAEGLTKAILYYTDNRLDAQIMSACQRQLEKAGLPIVSVSLAPLSFGQNIVVDGERGPLTLFRQILAGLEAMSADVVFFAEHDVLYSPDHFDFTPQQQDVFYYNQNVWKVDAETGKALFHYSNHTSQLCAYRSLLLEHYRKRVALVQERGFSNRTGYEPGTHGRPERVDDYGHATWMSEQPNIDLRHGHNLTPTRWSRKQFRNKRYTRGWRTAGAVPGWGETRGRMSELLARV